MQLVNETKMTVNVDNISDFRWYKITMNHWLQQRCILYIYDAALPVYSYHLPKSASMCVSFLKKKQTNFFIRTIKLYFHSFIEMKKK